MLKINRQTDYAARVILALAKHGEGVRLSSAEIQREMWPRITTSVALRRHSEWVLFILEVCHPSTYTRQ